MGEYRKVCLVGFDKIVGSFALGLKRIGYKGTIVGVGDAATITECWKLGLISDGSRELAEAIVGSDLIMVSSRAGQGGEQLPNILDLADEGATVSEMTRVKGNVNRAFEYSGRTDLHYVGFRLLGAIESEHTVADSNKFYFEKKTVILTPRGKQDLDAFSIMQDLMRKMGAKVVAMSPQAHDQLLARLYQVPHASTIAVLHSIFDDSKQQEITPEMLGEQLISEMTETAALRNSGWVEDLEANRDLVVAGLENLILHLEKMRADVQAGRFGDSLDQLLLRMGGILPSGTSEGEAKLDLIIVAGSDMKILERAAEILAKSRISVGNMDRLPDAQPGTFRLSFKTSADREQAGAVLKRAGVETVDLSS